MSWASPASAAPNPITPSAIRRLTTGFESRRRGLRDPARSGHKVELLLDLLQAQAHALLVQRPEIAAQGAVDLFELIELKHEGAQAVSELAILLADRFDALAKAFVSLIHRGPEFGELAVDGLPCVFLPLDQDLMSLDRLLLEASDVLAQGNVDLSQLLEGRIDVRDRASRLLDQVEGMGHIRPQLVDPRRDIGAALDDLCDAPARLLVDNLDRVLIAEQVATNLLSFTANVVD